MTTRRTTNVATIGKKVASKGKSLQRKAGATARKLKKKATTTGGTASRKVKKVVKKAKSSAAVRQAGKFGRAVGGVIGQTIGTVEKVVTNVIKK